MNNLRTQRECLRHKSLSDSTLDVDSSQWPSE